MPATDLALLLDAAGRAGAIAMRHFRQSIEVHQKPAGQGPVSQVDLEIDTMLRSQLVAARPGYGWLSEETPDTAERLDRECVFLVDPLDGTRAYLDGQEGFAHALAVVENGRVTAAVVALPALGQRYWSARGQGAWLNGQRLTVTRPASLEGARFLVARPQLVPALWPGGVPPVARHLRPALAWRLALVGSGCFDGMLTLRDVWDWDLAAASLIAEEAGARVCDRHGAALRFNTPRPQSPGVLAAAPSLVTALLKRLRPR